jgi:CheY-like chemotaxis protein
LNDLAANRKVLVLFLRDQGHRVHEAADGREGLAAVQADPPDLVIADVLMPVMDGHEFARQLRLDRGVGISQDVAERRALEEQ